MTRELLGPWMAPNGREWIFLACAEGERVEKFIGPFLNEDSIAEDDVHSCCENAHFRTTRLPAGAFVRRSYFYMDSEERRLACDWILSYELGTLSHA